MRPVQPSALPAEYAERVSDRDEDERPWRRPRRKLTPRQIADKVDEITADVRRDNDEAEKVQP